jgi:hypothetical protein
MHHLETVKAAADLAEEAQPTAARRFQRALLAAVEAQEAQIEQAVLGTRIADPQQQLATRNQPERHLEEPDLELHRDAEGSGSDGRDPRLVLIAQRKMQNEIFSPLQAQLAQMVPDCRRRRDRVRRRHQPPSTSTASASTNAPRGSAATPTAARAGNGSEK